MLFTRSDKLQAAAILCYHFINSPSFCNFCTISSYLLFLIFHSRSKKKTIVSFLNDRYDSAKATLTDNDFLVLKILQLNNNFRCMRLTLKYAVKLPYSDASLYIRNIRWSILVDCVVHAFSLAHMNRLIGQPLVYTGVKRGSQNRNNR